MQSIDNHTQSLAPAAPPTPPAAPLPAPTLSAREIEVLRTWLLTDSKADVCRCLYISPATVNTHLTRIRNKYHLVGRVATTKAALLARALQDGHITLDEL